MNDLLNELVFCMEQKNQLQYQIFSNFDIIEESETSKNVFLEYQILHQEEFIAYRSESHNFVINTITNRNMDDFMNEYERFMSTYQYKGKKRRYAVQLKLLYPKRIVEKEKEVKFIKEFIKQLISVNVDLPITVENIKQRNGTYAVITIIERAYIGKSNYKIYRTNKWIDTRTGKWASRHCPSEFKKLKCKKGDYCKDRKGKLVANEVTMFSKDVRIFRYAKAVNGRNMWEEFIEMLKNKVVSAAFEVLRVAVKKGKVLHKKQNKKEYPNIIKRRIGMINYAKDVIMTITNYLLQEECKSDVIYTPPNEAKAKVEKHTKKYHAIIKIFETYKARFKKESFHDLEGQLRHIRHCYQRIDELEENIRCLVDMFIKDIKGLNCQKERLYENL